MDWIHVKEEYLNKDINSRRNDYFCKEFLKLEDIEPLSRKSGEKHDLSQQDILNGRISLYKGDITRLEVDAIVNPTCTTLHCTTAGVDRAIHKGAGEYLIQECRALRGCPTGEARISGGYKLPAKHIIHTVGPREDDGDDEKKSKLLESCYQSCLQLAVDNQLKTIAFPCIGTGNYGFPQEKAAEIALSTTKTFLEKNQTIERVIFCVFLLDDHDIYKKLMPKYFPSKL